MSFPADRIITAAPGLEIESAHFNAIQDAICWQSRCLPRSVGTVTRDGSGALSSASVDYDPHSGAFAMTNGGTGIKWTPNGTEYWTVGSSVPGTPGGSESGYALKTGPGCLLLGHGTASGSTSRFWRSTNGGSSWSAVALSSSVTNRPRFFRLGYNTWICEENVTASGGSAGPYMRSTNGGVSFSTVGQWDANHNGVRMVARSPLASVVIAGVENTSAVIDGVFVSTNEGLTWTFVTLPGSAVSLKSLGWTPRLGFFAAGDRGDGAPWLWSSTDGATWIDAMGPVLGQPGATWATWGSSGVVSCGHLLMGYAPQSSPSLGTVLFSLGGVGAPWYRAFLVGSVGPLLVQESWPTFNGGSGQRPMPFSPVFTGSTGYDLSMIVAK